MINALKYLVYAMTIYVLLSFIPQNKVRLFDLLLIIILIISFNLAYDFIETNQNPFVEGYDPNPNEKSYSDALGESDDDRNAFNGETDDGVKVSINKNNPTKINPELEKPDVATALSKNENSELPVGSVEDDSNLANANPQTDVQDAQDIQALDTSNSSNLASLELKPEDEDKKDKIEYRKDEEVNKFKYGYSYMDTNYWNLPAERTPVCKNIKPCKVCPRQTTGFEKDRMKWN